ncbi:PREDICTED: uncharacterized protein LOC109339968 [Lupinus angustifolius]|uniref:uncharacterized protein LOC109339968 n=1 Tax=Lupinus angustifolius TaxID=3871 RepID=UPI00092F5F41|nr:PREDICTED: uncharacterized protein LOC109339968 [Lupinus angustifolius]
MGILLFGFESYSDHYLGSAMFLVYIVEQQDFFHKCHICSTHYLQRRFLWVEIQSLMLAHPGPWCCIGDFNAVLGSNECRSARLPDKVPCEDFQKFTNTSRLTHLSTRGVAFTWTNKRKGRLSLKKDWIDAYAMILGFPVGSMLLVALFLELLLITVTFCFILKFLIALDHLNSDFTKCGIGTLIAKYWWRSLGVSQFLIKLKDWNANIFGNVPLRVKNALANVEIIQSCINASSLYPHLLDQDLHAQNQLLEALTIEEDFYLVGNEENAMLISIPTSEEIKSVVFSINGEGAPGPDCFGGCFYQQFWEIVSKDVCNSVTQFFLHGWVMPNMNSNSIILILKPSNAERIEDYRPIALANFQFKIITKVLADRLASIAARIFSPNQRGFIKDRNIKDCICIASEAINLLEHKTFGGNLAIKLDITKAFDTMD